MNVSLRSKHQAPKREAFGCRDAPPRFIRGRRSRGLAPGWQTKGADIHSGAVLVSESHGCLPFLFFRESNVLEHVK
jgi:hypothetical protein